MLDEQQDNSSRSEETVSPGNRNHYDILAVATNATTAQINSSYKKLSLIYHPDRNANDEAAAAKLFEVNEAYQTLSDAKKRKDYDASIGVSQDATDSSSGHGDAPGDKSLSSIFSNFASVAVRVATTTPLFSVDLPDEVNTTAKALCE